MSHEDARNIIEKADLAVSQMVSDGGYLNPEQSDTFIRKVMEQPTVINRVRTVTMNSPKMNIDKIGFGSRILRAAPSSGTPLKAEDRVRPEFDQVQLETEEVMAEAHIPYDALEDSIERGDLENTIMDLIGQRASLDLEELLITGDTTSDDSYLSLFDGAIQLAQHEYDGSAISDFDKSVFKPALQTMPEKYLRNLGSMEFMASQYNVIDYRDKLADRSTGAGDDFYLNRPTVYAFGVPVVPAPRMPDNTMLFTYPQNLLFGMQRDIMIETQRDIRSRVLVVVLTMRIAINAEESDAMVKVTNLNV